MKLSRASIRRHGWVVPACLIIVVAAAVLASRATHTSYRSDAVLVVPITATGNSGALAAAAPATYAEVIAQDDAVAAVVARAVRSTPAAVRPGIAATQATNTTIIDVSFTSTTPAIAVAGATAIVRAVTGSSPATQAIPARTLKVVRAAAPATRTSRHTVAEAVPIGIVLGLLLGIGLFLAWDRQDARADDAEILEREIGLPVTTFGVRQSPSSLRAIQERWRRLSAAEHPKIAFVGVTADAEAAARRIRSSFEGDGTGAVGTYIAPGRPDGSRDTDDADDAAAIAVMSADMAVLIVTCGDRLRAVRDVMEALRKLGIEPRWVLLTDRA